MSKSIVELDYYNQQESVNVNTNVPSNELTYFVPDIWCSCAFDNNNLLITVNANEKRIGRQTVIQLKGPKITKNILIKQDGRTVNTDGLAEAIKVPIKSATASSSNSSSESIEKSYDGNASTIYHSKYSETLPVTLNYIFENEAAIDYLVYYPRTDYNKNGIFKRVKIKAATKTEPNLDLGEFDMSGINSPYRISLPVSLVKPVKIEMEVISSAGNSAGEENRFASCSEMEFYGKDPNEFDYTRYFTDATCSELKSGITQADIGNINEAFYRQLATEIFNGQYNKEFRVQTFQSYRHPDVDAKMLKTSTYGLRDNPTGIAAGKNEEVIILAEDMHGKDVSVVVQDPKSNGIGGVSYPIYKGVNRFTAPFAGLLYVVYYTSTGEEPPVKLNIVTGNVNGYFDSSKHEKEDWPRLINGAVFEHFDLKGKYATLTFETKAYLDYVPDGKALVDLYDKLVYDEQEFMGLIKYKKQYRNRAHFQVMYTGYMHAANYHTAYNASTQKNVLDVDKLTGKGMSYSEYVWGPAHELGHTHQTRPGLRWVGMTEVTNNLHSAYVQTRWTGKCRLQEENMSADGGYANRYEKAFAEILDAKISYIEHKDPFCKLVPLWQLKLYMIDVLRKADFYKDIYEWVRVNPNLNNGASQLQFVEFACRSANLDLTGFFEKWGFLTPLDLEIEDYSKERHVVTQAMIDKVKANIAKKNYPKPQKDFTRITEATKASYQ